MLQHFKHSKKKKFNSFNSILLCPSIYCRLAQWFKDCTSILCSKDSMHAYTLLFISICSTVFECSRTNKLIWHTEVFKKTQANTPKNKKESLRDRGTSSWEIFMLFLGQHLKDATVLWHFPWTSGFQTSAMLCSKLFRGMKWAFKFYCKKCWGFL